MSTSPTVECTACGNQHRQHETDSGHCPDCGGECLELSQIYGPDGEALDPDPIRVPATGGNTP